MQMCNTKCKRKRGLIKKCTEIASLCNLKVTLVIYDKHMNSIEEFNSADDFEICHI